MYLNNLPEEQNRFSRAQQQSGNPMFTQWPSPPSLADINRPVLFPPPQPFPINHFSQNNFFPNPVVPYALPWQPYSFQSQPIPCLSQISDNQKNLMDINKINDQLSRMMSNNMHNNAKKQDKERVESTNQFHFRNRNRNRNRSKNEINDNPNNTDESMVNVAADENAQMEAAYNALKYLNKLDDKHAENVLEYFKDDLLLELFHRISGYNKRNLNYLFTIIYDYFFHLNNRLKIPNITYNDLIDYRVYPYDDFCLFGSRFTNFICQSNFFSPSLVNNYLELISKYRKLYPSQLLNLRNYLLNYKVEIVKKDKKMNRYSKSYNKKYSIDYQSVTFEPINTK